MDSPALPASSATQETNQLFGSFHLGEFELALPIGALQEVVPYPAAVTRVPLAPPHLLGLFNLRGMLIPLADLGRFLGLPDAGDRSDARVAVVASGEARLGVLFDRTGEMLRLATSQVVPFRHGSESLGLIESAFHLDERILQVLSADALARLPGLPQVLNPDLAEQARQRRLAQGRRRQAVSFRTGGRHMALPMAAIHEIIRLPELEHSVLADDRCLGRAQLRGQPVPVVDFARFLGLPGVAAGAHEESGEDLRRVLVLRRDDSYLGLLVDEVDSIVGFLDAQVLSMPPIEGQTGLIAGCISRKDSGEDDLALVDAPALHADPFLAHLATGHRDLYLVTGEGTAADRADRQRVRQTWVTFQLDRLMGLRIEQLCEVIDYDPALMRPPGAPAFVRGVLNLRQKLITVVDLRTLYGMEAATDPASCKILIVDHAGEKYGLVADSVQSILNIDRSDKLRVPALVSHHLHPELQRDLHEVAELPEHGTVLLLDAAPLLQRIAGVSEAQGEPVRIQAAT
ncbi:MAG TPA: chemotaxis protein CheW [Dyella sp.]|jgi:purine-binding chemotaxis protein CheW|nr:chemotaxis protein CheW [Dyella sp.]